MSQLLDIGVHDEDSGSGESQDARSSLSRCSSSSSIVTNAIKVEKGVECSTSLGTAWTDSKHSSYLDFMEANFVQNMFARSYCMEDVCGGTKQQQHHHHHHQHDCHTDFEENDYDSAESRFHSQETLACKMQDRSDQLWRTALRAREPTEVPWGLLTNPWVNHFRPRNGPSVSLETSTLPARNDVAAKRDVENQGAASPAINIVDQLQWTSHSISDSEKSNKPVAPSRRIVHLNTGKTKDSVLNTPDDVFARSAARNKRRILWSTYKQVRRTRLKTGNNVQGGNTFKHDGAVTLKSNS